MTAITSTIFPRCKEALSSLYHIMSGCYRYLGKSSAARACNRLAVQASKLRGDNGNIQPAEYLAALQETLRKDVEEFMSTGTLRRYVHLVPKVPIALLEVLDVDGFSPELVKKLHEELHIDNMDQLKTVLLSGRLKRVKGFSNAMIDHLKRSLKLSKTKGSRLLLWDAILQGNEILRVVRLIPEVEEASLTGSLRRGAETVGDIDMVVNVAEENRENFMKHFRLIPQVQDMVSQSWQKVSAVLYNNTQLDIRIADERSYGAALLCYTGSPDHLSLLNERAIKKGYMLSPLGLFDTENGTRAGGSSEADIYNHLGLSYIPPELREGGREIYRAGRKMLPELVCFSQINGDMRIQTSYGNGESSLSTIAHYVLNAFPHYEYIVVSDRLPASVYPFQFTEIDAVNRATGFPFLKKGILVEIADDGSIDIPDQLLRQADWITAIVNGPDDDHFEEKFIRACEHPYINCISNPSGRTVGEDEPGAYDWQKLFKKAALTGTALEMNAQPQRLDLSDRLLRAAAQEGVKIVINSCAQLCSHYDYMQMGVTMARRGWCSKENILNTLHWKDVEHFKHSALRHI